jgi:prepilin-type N-terminal cleavage/methylation domain-containing protein
MKRQRGFTLVELLTVVTIVGLVMAMAAMALRPNRGDRMKSFVRSFVGVAHEARQSAISLRQAARIKLTKPAGTAGNYRVTLQTRDPSNSANWINLGGGTLNVPLGVELCVVEESAVLGTFSPTCPMVNNRNLCVSPNGYVTVVDEATSCTDGTSGTGATVFIRTSDALMKYKLVMFGLTGLPKVMDQW